MRNGLSLTSKTPGSVTERTRTRQVLTDSRGNVHGVLPELGTGAGVMAIVIVLGSGVFARADYKEAYDAARQKLSAKDYPGVRAECDRALAAADLQADPRLNLLSLKASSYEREHNWLGEGPNL